MLVGAEIASLRSQWRLLRVGVFAGGAPDKKVNALLNKLDEHLKTLAHEHDFKEDELKAQVYEGEEIIRELSRWIKSGK